MSRFGLPAEIFQNNDKLKFTIYGIHRKKVNDAYMVGLAAVEEIIRKKIPNFELFPSVTDIETIADLTSILIPKFWITVTDLLSRENQIRQQNITNEDKKQKDSKAALTRFSAFLIYTAYNKAVNSKLNNILPGRTLSSVTSNATRAGSSFTDFDPFAPDQSIDDAFGSLSVLDDLQTMLDNMQEMFLTKEDQDVDPAICEPLNRAVFGIDDGDKPDPPLHPNCRCILVPVEAKVSEFFAS